jgi:beta-lactamase class A
MSINKRILLLLTALLLVGGVSFYLLHTSPKYIAQQKQIEESKIVHDKDTKLPYAFLNNVIAQSGSSCSVYYKSLDTGEVFYNYSGKMPAGGLIRPYIAAAVLQQVKDGDLKLTDTETVEDSEKLPGSPVMSKIADGSKVTVQRLLEAMMLQNDQTAMNKLVALAGRDEINKYLLDKGFADTYLSIKDFENTDEVLPKGIPGDHKDKPEKKPEAKKDKEPEKEPEISYTSVNDTVNLLTKLYAGQLIDQKQDLYLLSLFEQQDDRHLMGALLPRNLKLAQISADHGRVLNAAGIVYGNEKYILAMMTDKALRPEETRKTMNQISSIIFNTVNDKEVFKK